jgi:hypothetical protein
MLSRIPVVGNSGPVGARREHWECIGRTLAGCGGVVGIGEDERIEGKWSEASRAWMEAADCPEAATSTTKVNYACGRKTAKQAPG